MSADVSTEISVGATPPSRPTASTVLKAVGWMLAIGYVAAMLLHLTSPGTGRWAAVVLGPLTLGVGLAGGTVCARAARRAPGERRLSWRLLAAAVMVGVAGQMVALFGAALAPSASPPRTWAFALMLLSLPLFASGAALAIRFPRARGIRIGTALDAGLIVTAILLVLTRPSLLPSTEALPAEPDALIWLLIAQLATIVVCLVVGIVVLLDDRSLPGRYALMLAGAAGAFLVATVLSSSAYALETASHASAPAWMTAWVFLAFAALSENDGQLERTATDQLRDSLRRGVAALAVLILGAAALDAALRPERLLPISVAALVMAVLLAVRIHLVIGEVERREEDGIQLSHTRALMDLSRVLAGTKELDQTLEVVSQWACRLLDTESSGVELLTSDGTTLELRAVHGLPEHVIGMRFPVEGSFTGWVVRRRQARATRDPSMDPHIRPESAAFLGPEAMAAAPLVIGDEPLGAIFAANRDRPFDTRDLQLLASLADQAALAIENARLFEQVHALSLTDPLTGLANRRQLERDLAREFSAASRGRKLVLVLFDLDSFKEYNDRHGHLAGDEALRIFGRVLRTETRAMNLAARYGGDEFLALLTESDRHGGEVFIRRVAEHFAEEIRRLGHGALSVSAGMAEYDPGMRSVEDLIAAADRVLYRIKADRASREVGR